MSIDLNQYTEFVRIVTSNQSNFESDFIESVQNLSKNSTVNISLLLTAAIGMSAECGEFAELPKKCVFQGKPLDADTIYHMGRELGDIFFYWTNACRALNLDPNDVIAGNVSKLESRYPGGKFDPHYSNNRKEGDL